MADGYKRPICGWMAAINVKAGAAPNGLKSPIHGTRMLSFNHARDGIQYD